MSVTQRRVVKTVRLDRRSRERLRQAARASARTESDLIRDAIGRECDEVLAGGANDPLGDLIGCVRGKGSGYSERAHDAFGTALLRELRMKEKGRRRRR